MKKYTLNILFVFLVNLTFGQNKLFDKFNFDNGGYYMLGVFSESDKSSLQDSIGEFYTDDISILNEFKNEWVFDTPGKKYACGYHYRIYVCKQGEVLDSYLINLNCNEIVSDEGYFYFDPNKLRKFYGKLKRPIVKNNNFTNIHEARKFRQEILENPKLLMCPKPGWVNFEGRFRFTYKCKENTKDCLDEDGKIFKSIESEIKNKYPNEKFELSDVGGSWTTLELMIVCNKSLSDNFDISKCERSGYFGLWDPYELELETYWVR